MGCIRDEVYDRHWYGKEGERRMSDPIKILEIEEHEDGSATLQVECAPETFAAIFNVGFVSLIKTGLHWESEND